MFWIKGKTLKKHYVIRKFFKFRIHREINTNPSQYYVINLRLTFNFSKKY